MLVDGRHPVFLKTVDPAGRLITFDLIQLYFGEEADREELKDHDTDRPGAQRRLPAQRQPQAADPARAGRRPSPSSTTTLAPVKEPVSLVKLAAVMPRQSSLPFWITVRHGQVVRIAEQYIP